MNYQTPEEVNQIESQLKTIAETFEKHGFHKVKTPTLESFDILKKGIGQTLQNASIKFVDQKGQLTALRPDHTAPIAHLVATRMQEAPLPIKLYYTDPIFRNNINEPDLDIEREQAGIEIIGTKGPNSDADAIQLCYETLSALGIKDFGIDIGHIDFSKGLTPEKKEALLKGDFIAFGGIPEIGPVSTISKHKELCETHNALIKKIEASHIQYNQGLVKGIHYYTGIIFEAYCKKTRQILASGGRYDQLLSRYGFDQPAIGFTLELAQIQRASS